MNPVRGVLGSLSFIAACSTQDVGPVLDASAPAADGSAESAVEAADGALHNGAPMGPCTDEGTTVSGPFFTADDGGTVEGLCSCTAGQWHCCPNHGSVWQYPGLCAPGGLECWEEGASCKLFDLPCCGSTMSVSMTCHNGAWSGVCWDCFCPPEAGAPDVADADAGGPPTGPCSTEGETITGDFLERLDGGAHPATCTCTGGAWHCCPDFIPGMGSCIQPDLPCSKEGDTCHLFDLPCPCFPLSINLECHQGKWSNVCWDCFCDGGVSDASEPG